MSSATPTPIMENVRKARKPNWNDREMSMLAESVSENLATIRGKFSSSLTNEKKMATWSKITDKVNAVTVGCVRTVEEVKKRWQEAQSLVKKKENQRLKMSTSTGGGPEPEVYFKSWEMVVLRSIPQTAIIGLDGAVDTSADKTTKTASQFQVSQPLSSLRQDNSMSCVKENVIFIQTAAVPSTSDSATLPPDQGTFTDKQEVSSPRANQAASKKRPVVPMSEGSNDEDSKKCGIDLREEKKKKLLHLKELQLFWNLHGSSKVHLHHHHITFHL